MTDVAVAQSFAESLERMLALYAEGDCLAAWEIGRQHGPLAQWPGTEAQMLAGRLAMHLGAPRLGSLLHLRAFRARRGDPDAQYYYIFRLRQRRGALAAWQERMQLGRPVDDQTQAVSDYHGQCAQLLGVLRDFEAAEQHIEQASLPSGARPYWYVERSELFELEDRYDDALRTAQEGLALHPRYPPIIFAAAHCLQVLGRDEEALHLLRSSATDGKSSHLFAYLIRLLIKRRLLDDVPEAIEHFEALTPLREKEAQNWLTSTRAEVATYRGDYAAAMEYIAQVDHPFYGRIAENLRAFLADPACPSPRRVELEVPFVRQHHLTCAPATLTAISHFWSKPAEHLSVAEEICYDGTPDYSERHWASTHGWMTSEFRIDWGSATALIDRSIPFTLTTSGIAAGHLQAVIGYDSPTGVLLARDPFVHETIEISARDLVIQQASTGPRAMVMVPREHEHLLDGLRLPDRALYDLYHEMQMALERHDREGALELHRRMIEMDADHRLTHTARGALAGYDENAHESLAATDALLALFPNDQRLHLVRLGSLRQLASRDDRLAWLEGVCKRPGCDPLLWVEYATELAADDRRLAEALALVRRSLRRRPDDAPAIELLAELYWRQGQREEAIPLYRFAACLAPGRDDFALNYFTACRWLKRPEMGIGFLRARFERAAGQAAGPTISLFRALELLDRTDEALSVLDAGVERRPDDGALRLFAANRHAQYGRAGEARTHLDAARTSVKHTAWLAEAAREARLRGARDEALGYWHEILRSEPLNLAAHGMTALLLSETATREDAVAHVRSFCKMFPHHAGLHRLLYRWSANDSAAAREPVLRKLLAIDPADAWAMRELALNLNQQSRGGEALAAVDEAIALERSNPAGHGIKGSILTTSGRFADAAVCYRAAITWSADASVAIHGLLDVCGLTLADRMDALTFIQQQLEAQPLLGDGVLAYRAAARGVLTPDELLVSLQRLHQARPDLWHAWSALARHLTEMGRTDEALAIASEAAERFSKVSRLWYDVSVVHRTRLEFENEVTALQRYRELDPEASESILSLVPALERTGRVDEAQRLVEMAITRSPLAPELRVALAQLHHQRGETERAIETVREAIRISPESDWAWQTLTAWLEAQGDGLQTLAVARAFAEARPRETQAWIRLAQLELRVTHTEEALSALNRAIEVNPQNETAHDLKAVALAGVRRFRDARDACDPPALRHRTPFALEGRAAWVDAQRGDLSGAIGQMQALVQRIPDYQWGWAHLVEWHAALGQLQQAAECAVRCAWLDPGNVAFLGWLGDLRQRLGDHAGAREAFERAMRLEPSYLFAGLRYFGFQKEAKDYDGAARTLEILGAHVKPELLLPARVELEIAQLHLQPALELIRESCRDPDIDRSALVAAVDAVPPNHWQTPLERTLREVLHEPTWNSATPELWARARVKQGRLAKVSQYRWLAAAGDPGKPAIDRLLTAIGERARRRASFPLHPYGWYLDVHLALIRHLCRDCWKDDFLWGKMGFALTCRGRTGSVIRWLGDWRQRPGAQSWMLHNLVLAFLDRQRDAEALTLLRYVMAHYIDKEDIGHTLRLWGALGACLDGDLTVAERLLHETPGDTVPETDRPVRAFAQIVLEILHAPRARPPLTVAESVTFNGVAQAGPRDSATARLVALARYRVAYHVDDRWMQFGEWRALHPGAASALTIAAMMVILRVLAALAG